MKGTTLRFPQIKAAIDCMDKLLTPLLWLALLLSFSHGPPLQASAEGLTAEHFPSNSSGNTVRVLTWNVQNLKPASETPLHQQALARSILNEAIPPEGAPDILFLQELTSREALEDLNELLAPLRYTTVLYAEPSYSTPFSVGMLSRLPTYGLPKSLTLSADADRVKRSALIATLVMPRGELLQVGTTHLPSQPNQAQTRSQLLSEFTTWLRASPDLPTIAGGDFNLTFEELSNAPAVRAAIQGGAPALPSPNDGPPGTFFFRPLSTWSLPDFLFSTNSRAQLLSASMTPSWWAQVNADTTPRRFDRARLVGVSDHFPLRATFKISDTSKRIKVLEKKGVTLRFPEAQSLDSFLRSALVPAAQALMRQPVPLASGNPEAFLERMAPEARALWLGSGLPGLGSAQLSRLLSALENRSLILNHPQLKLSNEDSLGRPHELENGELSMIGRLFQYDQERFIHVLTPNYEREWYFFPVSRHNLRSYSAISSMALRDLTYPQLCEVLERLRIPIAESWLELLSQGLTDRVRTLPQQAQEALLEVGGIYLAEQFKRIPLGLSEEEKPWMSGSNTSALLLLNDYFSAKGASIVRGDDEAPLKVTPGSCSTYQLEYRKQRCPRLVLEIGISGYMEQKYPELISLIRSELACLSSNIFKCLSLHLSRGESPPPALILQFSKILRALREQQPEVSSYIQTFSKQPAAVAALEECDTAPN